MKKVAGGIVDVFGDAALLVDDANEAAERVVVVATGARHGRKQQKE